MNSTDPKFDKSPQIYAEQVAQLYRHVPLTTVFNLLNGLILVIAESSQIVQGFPLLWLVCLYLLTICRAILGFCFARYREKKFSYKTWNLAFGLGALLNGLVWGSAALVMFPSASIEHQSFLIMMLAGMTAGAVSVLSAQMSCFVAFAAPALLPLVFRLADFGSVFSNYMAGMTLLFLSGILVAARGVNRTLLAAISLRYDNRELSREIADRQAAENALVEEKERLQTTLEALAEGVVIANAESRIRYLNPAAERLSGWANAEAEGRLIEEVFPGMNERTGRTNVSAVHETLTQHRSAESNFQLISRSGSQHEIREIASPLRNFSGEIIGAVAVLLDVTRERRQSRELAHQAYHDALTRLPNRQLLSDRLKHAIEKAQRGEFSIAVLFMDLDRFKHVNDSMGHAVGDELLKIVANRLRSCIRKEDTVARLSGDEFVIVLEQLRDESLVAGASRKVVEVIAKPILLEGFELLISTSIGVSIYPKDGANAEQLLKNADTAMYRAKEQGPNHIQFYSEDLNARALERLLIEQQLRRAIRNNELELYYQPRVDMGSGAIIGNEALLRWRRSATEFVLPGGFIPIAEESGCIDEIGEWVLERACRQANAWRRQGFRDLKMAVNFSARQIEQPGLGRLVARTLRETQLDPSALELEITERLLAGDPRKNIDKLFELKKLGVCLAIDDFGTGFSSLNDLKRLPVDTLKVDQTFVRDIQNDTRNAAIVSSIISLGHGLNLKVIAEGVETPGQINFLRRRNCDAYQGNYFSRPLPCGEASSLMQARKTAS